MPDLHEAGGQYMQEEASDELHRIQGCLFDLVVVFGVPPAKSDAALFQAQKSSVGNGHAMRIPCQIAEYLLGPAKRRLYMTDPVLAFQRFHPGFKAYGVSEFPQRTVETEISGDKRCRKLLHELSPEQPAERSDGQKEIFLPRSNPALAVGR